jgi:hypothetical protein
MRSTTLESRSQIPPLNQPPWGMVTPRVACARQLPKRTDGDQGANGCEYLSNWALLTLLTGAGRALSLLGPETLRKRIHGKASPYECVGEIVQ